MKVASLLRHTCIVASLWMLPAVALAQTPEFEEYTVKKGDTCTSIARDFYGDVYAYDHIHEHNDLSADDYSCKPGRVLRLIKLPEAPAAAVSAARGDVNAKAPTTDWTDASVGDELFNSWKVNTLEKSRADLAFRDESSLQMTENTLVIIYGATRKNAVEKPIQRASVERGRLKMRLAELSGQGVQVDTPTSIAKFATGKGQITVDGGETRVANHSGKSASVTGLDGKKGVKVGAGKGTRVKKGKPPEKPRPLPPTPKWKTQDNVFALALGDNGATIRAEWAPVKEAKRYYVEVTRDRRGVDVLFSGFVPDTIHQLEVREVPPGEYFAVVASVDGDKFESVPSTFKTANVLAIQAAPTSIISGSADAAKILLGSSIRPPRNAGCQLDGIDTEGAIRLMKPGRVVVACKGTEFPLDVISPEIEAPATVEIAQAGRTSFEMKFAPGMVDGLEFDAPAGIELRAAPKSADTLALNLTASADAVAGPIVARLGGIELSSIDLKVNARETVRANVGPRRETVWLSAMVGTGLPSVDEYWGDEFPRTGVQAQLALAFVPTAYFGVEAGVAAGPYFGDTTEVVLEVRGAALLGLFDTAVRPYLSLGFGSLTWFNEGTDPAIRPALGVMPELGDSFGLRVELATSVSSGDDQVRILPTGYAGLYWTF